MGAPCRGPSFISPKTSKASDLKTERATVDAVRFGAVEMTKKCKSPVKN